MTTVAVLDSGAFAGHPHLASARLRGLGAEGDPTDWADRTGHGTAVAAVIHHVAPEVDLFVVRVLDAALTTSSAVLARAIRMAQDADVLCLSLGSRRPEAEALLAAAVADAADAGAICVAAAHPSGRPLWPADLPGVLSAITHRGCPPDEAFVVPGALPRFVLHGHPRPIEGRPPADNLFGTSFAAARLAGVVARELPPRGPDRAAAVAAVLRARWPTASLP